MLVQSEDDTVGESFTSLVLMYKSLNEVNVVCVEMLLACAF